MLTIRGLCRTILRPFRMHIQAPLLRRRQERYVKELQKKQQISVVFFAMSVSMWKYQKLYERLSKHPSFCTYIVLAPTPQFSKEIQRREVEELRQFFDSQNIPYIEHEPLPLPTEEHKHNLLFVGEMEYAPNYNGVDRFIENIFPIVKRRYTDAQLRIVGRIHNSERYEKWSSVDGVTVCGFVKDIEEEYLNTAVVVVPIYEGAGTNIKVLEAMQYGRACVLSRESSCGFASHCNHGVEYLIADDDVAFAECVCELFESGSQYERIVKNAYSTVSKYYSRQGFVNTLRTALKQN